MAGRRVRGKVRDTSTVGGGDGPLKPIYTGGHLRMAMDIAYARSRIGQLAKRARRVNPTSEYLIRETTHDDGTIGVVFGNIKGNAAMFVEIEDVSKLVNSKTQKLFVYLLDLARHQGYPDGNTGADRHLLFRLEDLVAAGIFPDLMTAQYKIDEVVSPITKLHFSLSMVVDGERHTWTGQPFSPFTQIGNDCDVRMDGSFKWEDLFRFSMLFPLDVFYSLPSTAARLLFYIFFMARQKDKVKRIAETGGFSIPLRTIANVLLLKDPETKETIRALKEEKVKLEKKGKRIVDATIPLTKNPTRDIKDRVDLALEQIEQGFSDIMATDEFSISVQYDRDGVALEPGEVTMREYLAHGKIVVSFSGAMREQFLEIDRATKKRVEASKSKRNKPNAEEGEQTGEDRS